MFQTFVTYNWISHWSRQYSCVFFRLNWQIYLIDINTFRNCHYWHWYWIVPIKLCCVIWILNVTAKCFHQMTNITLSEPLIFRRLLFTSVICSKFAWAFVTEIFCFIPFIGNNCSSSISMDQIFNITFTKTFTISKDRKQAVLSIDPQHFRIREFSIFDQHHPNHQLHEGQT